MRGIVAVACSGGRDSMALLHATATSARAGGLQVVALHIHHGLQADADVWCHHVEACCRRWATEGLPVTFRGHRVTTGPAPGDSVEAWARAARYRGLSQLATAAGASVVLLAHHRRDQAETFLLQALRGAGVAGLSAMPARTMRDGLAWCRPWLDHPREHIEAYVAHHGLEVIEDASNQDPRFARNRLRLSVWPALQAAFADAELSLGAAARWAQQAARILDEVAATDVATCADDRGLRLAAWTTLGPDRRANALRHWLQREGGAVAPATLVTRLLGELDGAGPASWSWGGHALRRYRGCVRFHAEPATSVPPAREVTLHITRAGRRRLAGWGGDLVARRVGDGGVPLAWLAHLELRPRQGGERFQAGVDRPPRSLKKQYQAAGVPAWEREGPLLYSGGQLVFVPGLGVDARVVGLPGQAQLSLCWVPHTAAAT